MSTPLQSNTVKHVPKIVKYLFLAALMFPAACWVAIDKSLWLWDPAFYGSETIKLWRLLTQHPGEYLNALLTAISYKAPMIAWVGEFFVPFGSWLGYEKALLAMQLIASYGILYALCQYGNHTKTRSTFLIVALMVSSTPFFIFQSHFYFVEVLQTLGVTLLWCLYLNQRYLDRLTLTCFFLAILFFLLGVKITSPAYVLLPSVFIALRIISPKTRNPVFCYKTIVMMLPTVILITLVSAWYFFNFAHVLSFAKAAAGGSIALNYGHQQPILTKFSFWLHQCRDLFWGGRTQLLFEATLLFSFILYLRKENNPSLWVAIAQILIVLVSMSLQINEEIRYLYPLLPYWVFIFGTLISANRWITLFLMAVFLFRYGEFQLGTLGLYPMQKELRWSLTPDREGRYLQSARDIIDFLTRQKDVRTVAIGVDTPTLNLDALTFIYFTRTTSAYPPPLTNIGFAQTSISGALLHLDQFHANYFVTLPAAKLQTLDDFLNRVSFPLLHTLEKQHWKKIKEESDYLILKKPNTAR